MSDRSRCHCCKCKYAKYYVKMRKYTEFTRIYGICRHGFALPFSIGCAQWSPFPLTLSVFLLHIERYVRVVCVDMCDGLTMCTLHAAKSVQTHKELNRPNLNIAVLAKTFGITLAKLSRVYIASTSAAPPVDVLVQCTCTRIQAAIWTGPF